MAPILSLNTFSPIYGRRETCGMGMSQLVHGDWQELPPGGDGGAAGAAVLPDSEAHIIHCSPVLSRTLPGNGEL